uniref:Uncharacterized protein n=1 Tax=Arundo donax TaxID=35708 RepID=A0A0A9HMW0_ARUDO
MRKYLILLQQRKNLSPQSRELVLDYTLYDGREYKSCNLDRSDGLPNFCTVLLHATCEIFNLFI